MQRLGPACVVFGAVPGLEILPLQPSLPAHPPPPIRPPVVCPDLGGGWKQVHIRQGQAEGDGKQEAHSVGLRGMKGSGEASDMFLGVEMWCIYSCFGVSGILKMQRTPTAGGDTPLRHTHGHGILGLVTGMVAALTLQAPERCITPDQPL